MIVETLVVEMPTFQFDPTVDEFRETDVALGDRVAERVRNNIGLRDRDRVGRVLNRPCRAGFRTQQHRVYVTPFEEFPGRGHRNNFGVRQIFLRIFLNVETLWAGVRILQRGIRSNAKSSKRKRVSNRSGTHSLSHRACLRRFGPGKFGLQSAFHWPTTGFCHYRGYHF